MIFRGLDRWLLRASPLLALVGAVTSCGDDSGTKGPDVTAVCTHMFDSSCSSYTRCHVVNVDTGVPFTQADCTKTRGTKVQACVSTLPPADAPQVDQCAGELGSVDCSAVCGQPSILLASCEIKPPTGSTSWECAQ